MFSNLFKITKSDEIDITKDMDSDIINDTGDNTIKKKINKDLKKIDEYLSKEWIKNYFKIDKK